MLMTFGIKKYDEELAVKNAKSSLDYFAKVAGETLQKQTYLADPSVPTLADFAVIIPFYYSLEKGLTDEYKSKHPEIIAWAKKVFGDEFASDSFKDVKL